MLMLPQLAVLKRWQSMAQMARFCVVCANEFPPHGGKLTCCPKCAQAWKDIKRRCSFPPISCKNCGKMFRPRRAGAEYCSKSCKSLIIMNLPENKEKSRQVMLSVISRSDVQEKIRTHLRGSGNPFRNKAVREKSIAANRANGFVGLTIYKGGNGRGPTAPQALLAGILGWPMEVAVPTGQAKGSVYPRAYKLDIASVDLKIGVEIDGAGHNSPKAQALDAKKDGFLQSLGWRIVRLKNEEVMSSPRQCVEKVFQSTT